MRNQATRIRREFKRTTVARRSLSWHRSHSLALLGGLLLLAASAAGSTAPAELPPLRLGPKPADSAIEPGAYTLRLTIWDAAGNMDEEKSITSTAYKKQRADLLCRPELFTLQS